MDHRLSFSFFVNGSGGGEEQTDYDNALTRDSPPIARPANLFRLNRSRPSLLSVAQNRGSARPVHCTAICTRRRERERERETAEVTELGAIPALLYVITQPREGGFYRPPLSVSTASSSVALALHPSFPSQPSVLRAPRLPPHDETIDSDKLYR